ncbi:hypothetical protein P3X46_010874 [Hevea brasiliensis]|uniref:Coatomer subunit zeta n=1 Tax=Hevea brasiliensis TaxID=3981 RepID=A0ABQ9MJ98_HEVBR|nr:hypothetical protein P3X46_010874 [Hevea brasiliensis]
MILAVSFANVKGNILIERFSEVQLRNGHCRSFLVKLGADNLQGVKNEELLVASHKSVYIVYIMLGDVSIFVVGKDDYDELALVEVIFAITSAVKDVCGKPPIKRLFLNNGCFDYCFFNKMTTKLCYNWVRHFAYAIFLLLCVKGLLENTEKERIRRLMRSKPPTEF